MEGLTRRNFAFSDFSQFEKSVEIARSKFAELAGGKPAQFAQLLSSLGDECRLIALAAMRHRRQKGRVSLDEHSVQGHFQRGITNLLRLGKGYIACK